MEIKIPHLNILKRLEHAPSTLKRFTDATNEVGNQGFHYQRYLNDLQNFGFALQIGDMWHITGFGIAKLAEKKFNKVINERVVAGTIEETYDGADLKQGNHRVGAFDFLKYPSKLGENLVYPKQYV